MASTILQIKNKLIAFKNAIPLLNSWVAATASATAIWQLMLDVFANANYEVELLHDNHKEDVLEIIKNTKPTNLGWWRQVCKNFQLGYSLPVGYTVYDNTGISEDLIKASKIIAFVAIVEQEKGLKIKVAKIAGTDLAPLSQVELQAFKAYMKIVKVAGIKLEIISTTADDLLAGFIIKYNPQILKNTGERIDGASATPVLDAVQNYLKNLPADGLFSIQSLVDAVQAVDGVVDLNITAMQSKYGLLPFTNININLLPDSGYLRINPTNFNAIYIAQ